MSETFLSLDVGTTTCRASLFDDSGRCRAFASRRTSLVTDEAGRAEQDAEAVWGQAHALLRQVIAESGESEARAISVSVQGDAIIPVGRDGRALHNAVLGMDYRSRPQTCEAERLLGGWRIFRTSGMRPHPLNALCKLLWLRETRPDIYEKAWRVVTYAEFMLSKLGADPFIDTTMASRTMGFDLKGGGWSAWILQGLGIDGARLSPIVSPGEPVGTMSATLTQELGLRKAPLVVAGAHDQVCAALGAGVPLRAQSVISTGTAEVLSAALDRPILSRLMYQGHYPCTCYAAPGSYFTFSLNHTSGILLDWFRDLTGGGGPGGEPEALHRELPDGPSRLIVLPHFNGSGTPSCDGNSRGAILGLTLSTGAGEIRRALVEALAFELRLNLETLESAGVPIGTTAVVGGGARSGAGVQIRADVLERPLHVAATPEAASVGAAILAARGSGIFSSLREGIERMVAPGRTVEPRPADRDRYRDRFSIYRDLYPRLKPIFRRFDTP